MTAADLEAVIARTGHERYRWLTSDANPDIETRDGYRRIVSEIAAKPPEEPTDSPASQPLIPLAETRLALRLGMGRCFYASREFPCGCSGAVCHHLGRLVSVRDCVDCLGLS